MLDETDGIILRALAAPGIPYRTLTDLRQLTGLGLPALAARVPRLERLGYVWRLPDGTTGIHSAYRLSAAGVAFAKSCPAGDG